MGGVGWRVVGGWREWGWRSPAKASNSAKPALSTSLALSAMAVVDVKMFFRNTSPRAFSFVTTPLRLLISALWLLLLLLWWWLLWW